jgi:sulfate transport system permease protein
MKIQNQKSQVLPGLGLSLGFSMAYLSLLVLLPLAGLLVGVILISPQKWIEVLFNGRVIAAFINTFSLAALAAFINVFIGLIIAWVLVRYPLKFKSIIDGLIDLPFALPTAVAGITLTALYAKSGLFGKFFSIFGIQIAYTKLGILVALLFISLPFVIRTVQPVIEDMEIESEEAAACLGAGRFMTFRYVILPNLLPALLTGFALSMARALGEYGSIIFISGNMPFKTELVSLLIMSKLESFDYVGANVIAFMMLGLSFAILAIINYLQQKVHS